MSDWTSGYVTDLGYSYGYHTELNPLRSQLAFLISGLVPPKLETHCELGFGQGLSINMHAATTGACWYGTDFNSAQAGFAQDLQRNTGSSAHLFDEDFATFCQRSDLPDFDTINLHGTWSWVSDANRAIIVDFIRRKLKVGGVVYVSYNTQPGWAPMVPIRELLEEYSNRQVALGQSRSSRILSSLNFLEQLLSANPAYIQAVPQLAERLKALKGEQVGYLAHEYFNRDWHPMSFSKMATWLSSAKLDYACSSNYLDFASFINLSPAQQQLLDSIEDPIFRESVRDICVNQCFRRDYWVKGARRLSLAEQLHALQNLRIVLVQPAELVSLSVSTTLGETQLDESLYRPVVDFMSDHQPRTLGELEQFCAQDLPLSQLLQVVLVLSGLGVLATAQEESSIAANQACTNRLNNALLERACFSNDIYSLASPVIGGGVLIGRSRQLFLLAIQQGLENPVEWARFAWNIFMAEGHKLNKDGRVLEDPEDNLKELIDWAHFFKAKQLPLFKALRVMP